MIYSPVNRLALSFDLTASLSYRSDRFASMASLPSLPKPISQNPHFHTKPAAHSHSLNVIPRNHSFTGHGLLNFQHGSFRAREMRVIRSSNQTEAVPGKFSLPVHLSR